MGDMQAILGSMNVDLRKEHAAIVQYLLHAWQMGESGLAAEIEGIAREEMWHMEWLAEAIVEHGGSPAVDRAEIFTYDSVLRSLEADIDAEVGAIEHYRRTLELIGDSDEGLKRLIERIVDDESHHEADFREFRQEAAEESEESFGAESDVPAPDAQAVRGDIELEYEGLLGYLFRKYTCGDCEAGETYFEIAINEMRHLDWLAEATVGRELPSMPEAVANRVQLVQSVQEAQERSKDYEDRAIAGYRRAHGKISDEDFRDLIDRVIFQHDYHVFQLRTVEEED